MWNTKDIIADKITLEGILKNTTEFDIYSFYLSEDVQMGKAISSPFREDRNPSFVFFKGTSDNKLMWHDFATGESGDVVRFIKQLYDITYNKALKKIHDDILSKKISFSTKGIKITEDLKSVKTIISIKRKNFTTADDQYWGQYGLDRKTLKFFEVYPISNYRVNDEPKPYTYTKEQKIEFHLYFLIFLSNFF